MLPASASSAAPPNGLCAGAWIVTVQNGAALGPSRRRSAASPRALGRSAPPDRVHERSRISAGCCRRRIGARTGLRHRRAAQRHRRGDRANHSGTPRRAASRSQSHLPNCSSHVAPPVVAVRKPGDHVRPRPGCRCERRVTLRWRSRNRARSHTRQGEQATVGIADEPLDPAGVDRSY